MKSIGDLFKKSPKDDAERNETEQEIISIVNEGHEKGELLASEARMIENILNFDDKDAKDIMVHRTEIVGLDGEMTYKDALSFVIENHFSRYPVFIGNIDNVIGQVHIKDMLFFSQKQEVFDTKIRDIDGLIRPMESVPETHGINTLFTTMQREKNHLVLIVDEYGQTCGIVSMENILEEIVGSIQDEHDDERESVAKVSDNVFLMDGRTELSEASEKLGITFGEEYETLNGFLISRIHRIPEEHEIFDVRYNGFLFHVSEVHNNVICGVRVTREDPGAVESTEPS